MPYLFQFDSVHSVLFCTMFGHLTDHELLEYYKAAARYAQKTDPAAAILDLTYAGPIEISSATVKALARSDPALPDPLRPRFIVAPADHLYAMARMYQMVGEATRPRLRVVRSISEAYAALGIQNPHFEAIPET
ncbi:MAG TPA: hypothetical protein VE133_03970 [Candidatus Sulfotelmatobacter sp.]|nr:hypothetical protein [Candidatus Sulfotelmatobacter sp.]